MSLPSRFSIIAVTHCRGSKFQLVGRKLPASAETDEAKGCAAAEPHMNLFFRAVWIRSVDATEVDIRRFHIDG